MEKGGTMRIQQAGVVRVFREQNQRKCTKCVIGRGALLVVDEQHAWHRSNYTTAVCCWGGVLAWLMSSMSSLPHFRGKTVVPDGWYESRCRHGVQIDCFLANKQTKRKKDKKDVTYAYIYWYTGSRKTAPTSQGGRKDGCLFALHVRSKRTDSQASQQNARPEGRQRRRLAGLAVLFAPLKTTRNNKEST